MKPIFSLTLKLTLILSFCFTAAMLNAQETDNKKENQYVAQNVKKNTSESEYYTFEEALEIDSLPSFIVYLKNFISWKHWRFWVALASLIVFRFIVHLLLPPAYRLLPRHSIARIEKKGNSYYLFWLGYSFLVAIFFSFAYNHVLSFFQDIPLYELPNGRHWIDWVLWSPLALLVVGFIPAFIYDIVTFRFASPYSLFLQAIHAIMGMLIVFFITTALMYIIVGVGIALGSITGGIIAIAVLFFFLMGSGSSSGSSVSSGGSSRRSSNSNQKRINEEHRRNTARMEKFNRDNFG